MRIRPSHRSFASLIVLALLSSVHAVPAAAVGFGGFIEYGRDWTAGGGDLGWAATAAATVDPTTTAAAIRESFDRNEIGFGFALDTNLARDRVFNYRLDLGFHIVDWANPNVFTTGPPLPSGATTSTGTNNGYGFMWNNAFGFGVVRTENFRLWLGPAARMNVDYYENSFSSNFDLVDFQVGVGPQVGFNVNLGRHFTTTLSVAYNYKWGWLFSANNFAATNNATFSHTDNYVGANLAFFFRTSGDNFDVGR